MFFWKGKKEVRKPLVEKKGEIPEEIKNDIILFTRGGVMKKCQDGMVKNPPRRENSPTHTISFNLRIFFPANS